MNRDIPHLTVDNTILNGLNALINSPFICISDEQGYFDGILTRRAILKQIDKIIYKNKHDSTNHISKLDSF